MRMDKACGDEFLGIARSHAKTIFVFINSQHVLSILVAPKAAQLTKHFQRCTDVIAFIGHGCKSLNVEACLESQIPTPTMSNVSNDQIQSN